MSSTSLRLPRTRGDGPRRLPRTRGDGPVIMPVRRRGDRRPGFPAHAGMDPQGLGGAGFPAHGRRSSPLKWASPHTRGWTPPGSARASPHTRGWTWRPGSPRPGFPAHAGMDPRAPFACMPLSEASPHTRGWTQHHEGETGSRGGFPAHAGMDPSPRRRRVEYGRLPRTRGDGPLSDLVIGDRISASPHTRGWTPVVAGRADGAPPASPHTRGWTLWRYWATRRPTGFPAHAGMDPRHGDDLVYQRGFPAHAGMDPSMPRRRDRRCGLPRTRGDGPR